MTASGTDDENTATNTASASDSATYQNLTPSIAVTKSHTGTLNEGTAGQVLVYSFTVSNTSAASTDPVTVTALSDTVLGNLLPAFTTANGGSATLAAGASRTFTVNYTAPVANAGAVIRGSSRRMEMTLLKRVCFCSRSAMASPSMSSRPTVKNA